MIILIGGESHTGKTLLAQRLLEKYHFPYTSLDHIKMGLIRGDKHCDFTALDSDDVIAEKLWGIVKGMIQTCRENKQNIIIEGCYLPVERVKEVLGEEVIACYLIFSKDYIRNHFDKVLEYENVIEQRNYPEERSIETFIAEHQRLKAKCIAHRVKYIEITDDYKSEIKAAYDYIESSMKLELRTYEEADLTEIGQLFYDTVHTVNAKDYSKEALDAWASGNIDEVKWHQSLLSHYSIIAKLNDKIVGFGDVEGNYLDRLYVHKDYQNRGVGRAIAERLEDYAKQNKETTVTTYASLTARPFFEKRGYLIIEEQQVKRNDALLKRFRMVKEL